MSVQYIEKDNGYQARVHQRGPGQTKFFAVAQHGETRARELAERWEQRHKLPRPPKPATSTRTATGLRGIGLKWAGQVLNVVVNVPGRKTTRSVREYGPRDALCLAIAECVGAGVPEPNYEQYMAALNRVRAELDAGAPLRNEVAR